MNDELDFDVPVRFTVGTEGPVGQRLFVLQCRQGSQMLTVKIEKQQVAVLGSYLARIVKEVGRPGELPENLDLETFIDPDWTVGTIGVSYDDEVERVVVIIEELTADDLSDEDEADEEELLAELTMASAAGDREAREGEGNVARVSLTLEQAAAFAIRATQLVEAGRAPCPLCGLPLDPAGHICPRTNGHRPPIT